MLISKYFIYWQENKHIKFISYQKLYYAIPWNSLEIFYLMKANFDDSAALEKPTIHFVLVVS